MSECDNTDCIMETIELEDAKARMLALEGVVEDVEDYLIEQTVKNNNKADNSKIGSRTREFYESKTSAYRDAKERLLQALAKLEEV